MTELAVLARVVTDPEFPVEQLSCHPRLPLAAGTDADGRTVRVWDCSGGRLRELPSLERVSEEDNSPWWRPEAVPAPAWHPELPLLAVPDGPTVARWTPDGTLAPLPAPTAYQALAFSPDGRTLWAAGFDDAEEYTSYAVDPETGAATPAPGWDTGVATHPSGALVATLISDQGATLCRFARPADGPGPGPMRPLRQTLVLDVDGYGTPLFSSDGRYLAVRGNAYVESVDVFAFPSQRLVTRIVLPEEDGLPEWSRHNLAFAADPGVLWIGLPTGTLLALDLAADEAVTHETLTGPPLTALAATAAGELLVAHDNGDLVLLSVSPPPAAVEPVDLTAFLADAEDLTPEDDRNADLILTDGSDTWDPDDLARVTETSPDDPTWLQLQAHLNRARTRPDGADATPGA
ncbi:hypothetical protein [Kitasatospora sp. NPDC088134]|uniref:hypothetical protein n=1 Tax=Kitasatospora sp. NPDC088134 TaxID=3364071 RepID=UPI00380CE0EB